MNESCWQCAELVVHMLLYFRGLREGKFVSLQVNVLL